jgi:hypothetical protein
MKFDEFLKSVACLSFNQISALYRKKFKEDQDKIEFHFLHWIC